MKKATDNFKTRREDERKTKEMEDLMKKAADESRKRRGGGSSATGESIHLAPCLPKRIFKPKL